MKSATLHLKDLLSEIQGQNANKKTLAYWRLFQEPQYSLELQKILETFATTSTTTDGDADLLLQETQTLFDQLNPILAQQEATEPNEFPSLTSREQASSHQNEISVVFGGKYKAQPQSISELLVSQLAKSHTTTGSRVFTVSRSTLDPASLPSHVTHIPQEHLDDADTAKGAARFAQVIRLAMDEIMKQKTTATATTTSLVFYFTLGQHKGTNPFLRNLYAARNFAQALKETVITSHFPWRVVLTGTDATLPSTHPDSSFTPTTAATTSTEKFVIPGYKIMEYNYTYAMSKLGQYYGVSKVLLQQQQKGDGDDDATAKMLQETESIWNQIQTHVQAAGEDGDYHPDTALISMERLDGISRNMMDHVEPHLLEKFWIAKGISICYTPLHAVPWSQQALQQQVLSPKAFILEQVVKRFKNSISIQAAVACHFPTTTRKE